MASSPVTTTVTELPESRVRVQAEVTPEEVERRVAQAARALARNLRVPGFRTGKAPPPVVIQRAGRIVPVGEPDLDLGELPSQGEPLRFSIEIGVRPVAKLGEYKGLEVGKREPQ